MSACHGDILWTQILVHISPLYQVYTSSVYKPKVRPGTFYLIIYSTACELDIKEVHGKLLDTLFIRNVHGHKHPREMGKM